MAGGCLCLLSMMTTEEAVGSRSRSCSRRRRRRRRRRHLGVESVPVAAGGGDRRFYCR